MCRGAAAEERGPLLCKRSGKRGAAAGTAGRSLPPLIQLCPTVTLDCQTAGKVGMSAAVEFQSSNAGKSLNKPICTARGGNGTCR